MSVEKSIIDLFSLEGRVAVVTGSTKGIGRAIVEGFAQAGADVVVSSRDQTACDEAAALISAETGRQALGAACHVGDWDAVPPFVDRVMDRFGKIDVLVNNAGINPVRMTVSDLTREYIDKLYEVNLRGPVRMAGVVAPIMAANGGGSIINVSAMGGYFGQPGVGAYTSAKAALIHYTKVMAQEWTSAGIRVNTLCPGPFDSEMMRGSAKYDPDAATRSASSTLMNRIADCREIVGGAIYLASDASSFVTGEDHAVAGGMRRG